MPSREVRVSRPAEIHAQILMPVEQPVHLILHAICLIFVQNVCRAYRHENAAIILRRGKSLTVLRHDADLKHLSNGSFIKALQQIMVPPDEIIRHGNHGAVFSMQMLRAFTVEKRFAVEFRCSFLTA